MPQTGDSAIDLNLCTQQHEANFLGNSAKWMVRRASRTCPLFDARVSRADSQNQLFLHFKVEKLNVDLALLRLGKTVEQRRRGCIFGSLGRFGWLRAGFSLWT